VKSATYFVSLLDSPSRASSACSSTSRTVTNLERTMNERGYLEGSEMAGTFNLMRANDLVWSFVVNNYLMGKDPFPFDLLYWNADSTRMPARMHSFYLRNMYLKNLLGVPGGISLRGVPIDLSKVKIPSYFISTVEDHIAPWKTTYMAPATSAARCASCSVARPYRRHRQSAGGEEYHYWTNPELPSTAEDWFAGATQQPGSWWEDWQRWIDTLNGGEKVPARIPAHALEDAPQLCDDAPQVSRTSRGLRGARAASRSYSQPGSARSRTATSAICHGNHDQAPARRDGARKARCGLVRAHEEGHAEAVDARSSACRYSPGRCTPPRRRCRRARPAGSRAT